MGQGEQGAVVVDVHPPTGNTSLTHHISSAYIRHPSGVISQPDGTPGTPMSPSLPMATTRRVRDAILSPEAIAARSVSFAAASSHIRNYNYHSWVDTICIVHDRAPSTWVWPWALCVAVSAAWVTVYHHFPALQRSYYDLREFDRVYVLIFTALGFLLVFRLSRAAIRYWECRTAWGTIAMRGEWCSIKYYLRMYQSVSPNNRDQCIPSFVLHSFS